MRRPCVLGRRPAGLLAVALAGALAGGCTWLGWNEATWVLQDLAAGDGASLLKANTPEPAREAVDFQVEGRAYHADLYRPGETPRAGLLLVPGAAPGGKDDPRLAAFARTLARARFLVLVPDLPALRRFALSQANVLPVADAARHLRRRPSLPGLPVGIAALSYSVGPAVLASLEPDVELDFLLGIGGYYDLERAITYATTGCVPADAAWRCREPSDYARWAMLQSTLGHLPSAADRALLERLAWYHLDSGEPLPAQPPDALGPAGRAAYRLLRNRDPGRVEGLLRQLPASAVKAIRALDLSRRDLAGLELRLILVHGRDDPMVPPRESEALAAALPEGRARLFLVTGLAHVEIDPQRLDQAELLAALRALLAQRGP